MTTVQKLDPTRLAPGATARTVEADQRLYCVEAGQAAPLFLLWLAAVHVLLAARACRCWRERIA
jgi:hypothetical protein